MKQQLLTLYVLCGIFGATTAQAAEPDPLCGAYTLYVSLKALDADVGDFDGLKQALGDVTPAGYSLGTLAETAESFGMQTLGVQTSLENLARRPGRFACIAHVNGDHFVNISDVHEGVVRIIDPPRSHQMPADTFRTQWDGTALLISSDSLLAEEDLPRPWPWKWLALAVLATFALYTGWTMLRGRRVASGG